MSPPWSVRRRRQHSRMERIRIMRTTTEVSRVPAKQIWLTGISLALTALAAPSNASAQIFRGWGFMSPSPPSWATPYPYDSGCASGSCGTQRPMPLPTTSWSPTYGYGYGMWNGASQPVGTARPVYQAPSVTPQRPVTRSGGNVESPYYTYQEGQASIRRTPVTVQPARRPDRPAVNPEKVDSPYYP